MPRVQVAVVVKCAMTPYQSVIYNWVKVETLHLQKRAVHVLLTVYGLVHMQARETSTFLSMCSPGCR
jgi:hypothetical protein